MNRFCKILLKIKWRGLGKELLIALAIFLSITWWQTKDMLSTDGSIVVAADSLPSIRGGFEKIIDPSKRNVVYFFAPWCQICALSIDNLNSMDHSTVNIVAVALDYTKKSDVDAFIAKHPIHNASVLFGNNELKSQFKIKGYPSYYLIDEKQKVVSKSFGYSTTIGLKLRNWFS